VTYLALTAFLLAYAVGWFLFNLRAIPPYIPGATMDPTLVPPGGAGWLALITGALVFPGRVPGLHPGISGEREDRWQE
jgi:hypothetical protein